MCKERRLCRPADSFTRQFCFKFAEVNLHVSFFDFQSIKHKILLWPIQSKLPGCTHGCTTHTIISVSSWEKLMSAFLKNMIWNTWTNHIVKNSHHCSNSLGNNFISSFPNNYEKITTNLQNLSSILEWGKRMGGIWEKTGTGCVPKADKERAGSEVPKVGKAGK